MIGFIILYMINENKKYDAQELSLFDFHDGT